LINLFLNLAPLIELASSNASCCCERISIPSPGMDEELLRGRPPLRPKPRAKPRLPSVPDTLPRFSKPWGEWQS
jgi:hypothetical protein